MQTASQAAEGSTMATAAASHGTAAMCPRPKQELYRNTDKVIVEDKFLHFQMLLFCWLQTI